MDVLPRTEHLIDRPLNIRIEMDRVHEPAVLETIGKRRQGAADPLESPAEVLAPVARDEHGAIRAEHGVLLLPAMAVLPFAAQCREQGVHDRVARQPHGFRPDPLGQQCLRGTPGRRAVERRRDVRNPSIQLLGPRGVQIAGPQAGLHVYEGDVAVEGRQRRCHDGRRVALGHHAMRSPSRKHFVDPFDAPRRQPGQRLIRPHQVKLFVGIDPKILGNLGQHFPVLTGQAYDGLQLVGTTTTLLNNRGHLDGFRSCAEDQ